jgi:hypothetical protein
MAPEERPDVSDTVGAIDHGQSIILANLDIKFRFSRNHRQMLMQDLDLA